MMQQVAFAPWRAGAREIERAKPPFANEGPDRLDDIGVVPLLLAPDRGRQRRDIHRQVAERRYRRANRFGLDGRQIALHVDDDVVPSVRIGRADRLENPIRARGVIGPRHYSAPPGVTHRVQNPGVVGGDHDRADIRFHGASPDVNDHGNAADVGERRVSRGGLARRGRRVRLCPLAFQRHTRRPTRYRTTTAVTAHTGDAAALDRAIALSVINATLADSAPPAYVDAPSSGKATAHGARLPPPDNA